MRNFSLLILIIFFFTGGFSFSQSETYTFPRVSSISLPISISVEEITNLINNTVKGTIYEDKSYTDNNNDQLKVKVDKKGNIKLTALTNNRILIEVPLDIWASKGYGALGKYTYQDTKFGVVMKFISSLEFKPNWTLDSKTKTYGFEWTEKPVLNFGSVKLPIASLIESTLTEQQTKFTSVIDDKIKESFDLKPYLLQIWNQFLEPMEISPEYKTWLKISPQTVYMTPMVIYKDVIKTTIGLDLFSETYIGIKPKPASPLMTFPNFLPKEKISNEFNIKTTANITFQEASALAKAQFLNKEFVLTSEKNKVKITDIKVYSEKDKIVIEAQTEGEVKGTAIIKGTPIYDALGQKITLTDIDFRLKTKNLLQKTLSLLFEGKITRMIERDYGIPLKDIELNARQSLEDAFNKEHYPGIFLKGKVLDLKPTQFLLSDQAITVVIDTQATLQMNVNSLQF